MTVFTSLTTASRVLTAVVVTAVFLLGAASVATHPGDDCSDEFCTTLQCDMATGSGCASLCAQAAATLAVANPVPSSGAILAIAGPDSGPGLRVPDRPFRPPALS